MRYKELLLAEYQSRRNKAIADAKAKRRALAVSDKVFGELESTRLFYMTELAKARAMGGELSVLKQKYDEASLKAEQYLQNMGYDKQAFLPVFSCNICEDNGKVGDQYCTCLIEDMKQRLFVESNLPYRILLNQLTVNGVKNELQRSQLSKLYSSMSKYVGLFPNSNKITRLFSGGVGVGKSTVAIAIGNEIINKGYIVLFLSAVSMNNLFLSYHLASVYDKASIMERLLSCDLLIIDDLGCEPILNNVTINYLGMVMTERVNRTKHTIITTNLDGEGILYRYGERVFSRIVDFRTAKGYFIEGEDLRKK